MRELKQQKKAEARRKKEAEEKSRSALTDLRKRVSHPTPPRLARHGLHGGLILMSFHVRSDA